MDGGEYVSIAGEFNDLKKVILFFNIACEGRKVVPTLLLHCVYLNFIWQVSKEQWTMMESMIRSTKGS